jgi:hypothetical protein
MRSCGLIAFGILFGASQLFGTTINPGELPCGTSTLDGYTANATGCTLGGEFSVSSFTFTASAGAPLSASDITVTPTVTTVSGTIINIDFNFSGDFSNPTANPIEYTFDYILDPRPPVINGSSISLDPSGVLTESICAGGTFSGANCIPASAFKSVLVATGELPNASTAFPMGVSMVEYHIVLDLQPGDSAGGFDSGSVTGLGAETGIPEPGAGGLAAAGLIALLAFGSRWRVASTGKQL